MAGLAQWDDWFAGKRQNCQMFYNTGPGTRADGFWSTTRNLVGSPSVASLDTVANSTAGRVPQGDTAAHAAVMGSHVVQPWQTSALGYVAGLDAIPLYGAASCRVRLFDLLFAAGPFTQSGSPYTLSSPPSYSSRVTFGGSADYSGLELWCEAVSGVPTTGTVTVTVTYVDQAGNTAHTTGSVVIGGSLANGGPAIANSYMVRLPLAVGDTGIQSITSITTSGLSTGKINIFVIRPLLSHVVNTTLVTAQNPWEVGAPQLFQDSCLLTMMMGSASIPFEYHFDILSKV